MEDFASTAMIRVMLAGIVRLGLPHAHRTPHRTAHTSLPDKRAIVQHVLQVGGWSALLQLGQGIHDLHDEPLLNVLVQKGRPWRALTAWVRLEKYLHSRHHIVQRQISEYMVEHKHEGKRPGAVPIVAESWLVLGVLVALLQRSDCKNINVFLRDDQQLIAADRLIVTEPVLRKWVMGGEAQAWKIDWQLPNPELAPTTSEAGVQMRLEDTNDFAVQVLNRIRDMDNCQPELRDVAQSLNLSARTLQRKLGNQGSRFVDIIGIERTNRASHLLAHSKIALAEVGFTCGYTDQAHFCRDFRQRTGVPPKVFRVTSQNINETLLQSKIPKDVLL